MKSTSTCTPRPNTWIPVWRPFSLSLLRHNQSPQWLLPPARIFARTALSLPRPLGITYDKHHYDRKGVLLPAKPLFSEMKQRWQSRESSDFTRETPLPLSTSWQAASQPVPPSTLLGMVARQGQSAILHRYATHILTNPPSTGRSVATAPWFIQIRHLCFKYNLPDPLQILAAPPTKAQWKGS